ncbi:hypothetical protein D3C81_1500370 [compost metagenome]
MVLPEDSGPNTSITRPTGRPPMPSAMSSPSEPVETLSISFTKPPLPSFITEPLPKARSICAIAASRARCFSPSSLPTSFNAACAIGFLSLAMIPFWALGETRQDPLPL